MKRFLSFCLPVFLICYFSECRSPTSAIEDPITLAGAPFPYADPEDVGLSSSVLQSFMNRVEQWVSQGRIVGGEVLIVKDRHIVFHDVSGWSDRERDIPLDRNSIYRIRSMTKPFIGTAILMLMEEGQLNLDDRVADYLPSFNNSRSNKITIRHLLTHTAGYVQGDFPAGYWEQATLREAVDLIGQEGPNYNPGSGFRYSDLNSAVLGGIAAELTGAPVEHFLQSRIFNVLSLSDTYSFFSPDFSWSSRMNSTYQWDGSRWEKYWDNTQAQVTPFFRASGGLYTTVFDYARFLTLWMDRGRLQEGSMLSDSTVSAALQRGSASYYGFHWVLYGDAGSADQLPPFGHSGSDGTIAIAIPERNSLALYFTQCRGTDTLHDEFLPWVREILFP